MLIVSSSLLYLFDLCVLVDNVVVMSYDGAFAVHFVSTYGSVYVIYWFAFNVNVVSMLCVSRGWLLSDVTDTAVACIM